MSLKKIIVAILVITSSFSGCVFFNNTTFSLISTVVYDDDGFASLLLNFNASDIVTITLSGPNDDVLFSDMFYRDTYDASIHLGSYRTNPSSGRYILNVYDKNNKDIFEKEFLFEGENLSISRTVAKWSNDPAGSTTYSLIGLEITVMNHGDLPTYPHTVDVTIDSQSSSTLIAPNVISPGKSNTLCCFVYFENISSETQHLLDISLKDAEGDVMVNTSYSVVPSDIVSDLEYTWRYNGNRYLVLPDPGCLYEYYSNLDRLVLEDYVAYVFDVYDDQYLDMFVEKFLEIFDTLTVVATVDAVASFVQNMPYVEDDPADPECEYPRYPIEMLKDERGDCEDKAILTVALLDKMGYNVSLLRLPNHMAVGVHLDENATSYDYYIDEYYYLETTRANWVLGRVPQEYIGLSNVTIHPVSPRSILIHSWKNATRYTSSDGTDFVKMKIIVENIGNAEAENVEVKGAFFSNYDIYYNQEVVVVSSLSAGEKEEVSLKITVPQGVSTILKTQIYLNNIMVDEKESTSTFS